jgi:iron complex transport system ATP-binding protein
MAEAPRYEAENLGYRYGEVWALRGVSFALGRGEVLGLLGPNGSGKSTLVRLLARLLPPREGTIRFDGLALAGWEAAALARRVAWMPQDTTVLYAFTVRDLVLLGRTPFARGFGFETDADRAVCDRVLAQTGLSHLADRTLETLSGGQRQRVLIAARLAQQPAALLLDEPLAHLDPAVQLQILALLRERAARDGVTVVLALHDLNLAAQYCDRVLLLSNGAVAALGPPEQALTATVLRDVYRAASLIDRHPISGRPRVTWIT